ncbi:Ger(x)C family spore germination protein [Paenibacillus sp. R14(2021)]|uniref:Ger(x)C family spore germination protein n=1 Tax=Paenibacillus sp. R14(2021) TaxID=2859228 RepID=UPI001C613FCB|nr:Ger(x)C family spore germination protein [Paenibacillus sp. R14(2021)]
MAVNRGQGKLLLVLLACCLLLTGCWDRQELNNRLFDIGGGIDLRKDGTYALSVQFVLPQKVMENTSTAQSYIIETSTGANVFDAVLKLQQKLSRKVTRGQRRNLYVGEELAMRGFPNLLDSLTRDPDNRIRTDLWIVKDGTALEAIKIPYPLEKIPAIAPLKIRQAIGTSIGNSLIDYLIAANEPGSSPTLPAIEIEENKELRKKTVKFYGRAIFNAEHMLVGYCNLRESAHRLWVINQLNSLGLTVKLPGGEGLFSVEVTHARGRTKARLDADRRVHIQVDLTGQAILRENNTNLDLTVMHNLKLFEDAMNRSTEKELAQLTRKTQKKYKSDIFGFGEAMNRQHPGLWPSLEPKWPQLYADAVIEFKAHTVIQRIGLQGPSLNLK